MKPPNSGRLNRRLTRVRSSIQAAAIAALAGIGAQAWSAESCNRACLESYVDRYLDAVVADHYSASAQFGRT
jgi:hypothetical protein